MELKIGDSTIVLKKGLEAMHGNQRYIQYSPAEFPGFPVYFVDSKGKVALQMEKNGEIKPANGGSAWKLAWPLQLAVAKYVRN